MNETSVLESHSWVLLFNQWKMFVFFSKRDAGFLLRRKKFKNYYHEYCKISNNEILFKFLQHWKNFAAKKIIRFCMYVFLFPTLGISFRTVEIKIRLLAKYYSNFDSLFTSILMMTLQTNFQEKIEFCILLKSLKLPFPDCIVFWIFSR